MGKASQVKGRRAEYELSNKLNEAGWSSIVNDIYESWDVDWEGLPTEVKRRAKATGQMKMLCECLDNGAEAAFFRADRDKWRVVMDLDTLIHLFGPNLGELK